MILSDSGKKDFLKSNFHQYFEINLSLSDDNMNMENLTDFVNFVLPLSKINEEYSLEDISDFFNDDYNNIIFTSHDNKYIYPYEFYQNIYFIRLNPFDSTIRMHFVPQKYDASDTLNSPILIFKDNKQNIDENNFACTEHYERDETKNTINLYYQEETQEQSNGFYKFDIKEQAQNFTNLQINMGYSYNDTNPTNKIKHITGILDASDENGNRLESNQFTEFNYTRVDINLDNYATNRDQDNNLTTDGSIRINPNWEKIPSNITTGEISNPHQVNKIYHKTIKYFNDVLYVEENGKHYTSTWVN